MMTFSYDVPMGCVLINLARKRSYAIMSSTMTHNISIRSGLHFVRNYGLQSLGFVFWRHRGRYEIAFFEVNRNKDVVPEKRRLLQKLNERLLKNLVFAFDHVAFWNCADAEQ